MKRIRGTRNVVFVILPVAVLLIFLFQPFIKVRQLSGDFEDFGHRVVFKDKSFLLILSSNSLQSIIKPIKEGDVVMYGRPARDILGTIAKLPGQQISNDEYRTLEVKLVSYKTLPKDSYLMETGDIYQYIIQKKDILGIVLFPSVN